MNNENDKQDMTGMAYEPVLGDRLLLERKGCNCCGGELVFIRGKYPKDEQREICPTCAYERLEEIHRISDADYGKTYCSNSNDT